MIESIKNEFIQNLGEIRNINLSNKKTYTFFYNELEEQITEHLDINTENKNSKQILVDQKMLINNTTNKIRGLTYSIENLFIEYNSLTSINIDFEKYNTDANYCYNLAKKAEAHVEDFKKLCLTISPELKGENGQNLVLKPLESFLIKTIENLKHINQEIAQILDESLRVLSNIKSLMLQEIRTEKEIFDSSYQTRFKEDTALIIKKFENDVANLAKKFENQYKSIKLDSNKLGKSHDLLTTGVDAALKNLADLNERTQNIELEYSKIIKTENDKIKNEIQVAKGNIAEDINTLFNEVNDQINAIKTTHSDLLGLVEKAGIYELTKNYKEKANEEKIEYKDYRKYTSWSIIAAIVSTIAVFAFAFWEQSQIPVGKVVETNYLLLVSRLSISLMFFVLALYLSKQAAKHYECYQENHRTFLQLAALEPFMARMTPEEQKEIRKGLIPSYFNQANDGKYASKGDEVDISSNITTIVNNLIERIPSKKEEVNSTKTESTTG
ncbi:hypothetical protein GCM10025882_15500 [Acinetobacter gyllenbergii]|uniref:Uncharacterized protein n=1 Tax=Acinetobacter gyllenbergii CIP 110306 = MTCC 11365 TaxID=1217657 RepID=A0A829HFX4_9GAMM|nr:hypothetical protein [Acinetobacter gyllenbergii]EPF77273.1 hypothetical protein F957_02751 [Acinetobacter gyllenbergii CIP 110306 = MTCC 11365]EPH33263.1 hypothetical protein L293_0862 [Acinetobacter gyllenbergii CIP 110306 = MTCC 11365]GMA11125.1 hypothetical protein GCM10025882_15500 [Acinetobacter gyllenbergii]